MKPGTSGVGGSLWHRAAPVTAERGWSWDGLQALNLKNVVMGSLWSGAEWCPGWGEGVLLQHGPGTAGEGDESGTA